MAVWLTMSLSQGAPNETARTTTVSATLTIHYSGGSYDGTQPSGEITIDGQSFPFVKNFNYSGVGQGPATTGTGSTSITVTATVSYGASSSRTVNASASFSRASGGASGSITLTPISSSGGSSGGGDDDDDNTEEWNPDNPGPGGSSGTVDYNATVHHSGGFVLSSGDAFSVKFTAPEFSGTSKGVYIDLIGVKNGGSPYIGIALCTSDANLSKYKNTSELVDDVYRLENVYSLPLDVVGIEEEIPTTAIKSDTDYYLIFWNEDISFSVDEVKVGVAYTNDSSGGDSGEDPGNPDNPKYRYLWIQKVEGTSVSVSVYESTDNYIDVSDAAEERSDDNGLWYVYTFQQGNYFRFNIAALSGYTLGEINITGLNYNAEYNDYTFNSDDDAYVTVEVTGGPENVRGVFYIDNGTEFIEYECYIDNGAGWDLLGGDSTDKSKYYRKEGTVTTNSDGTSVSVDCGFAPDLVVCHNNETYGGQYCSAAAALSVHNGDVITTVWSPLANVTIGFLVGRYDRGFSITSFFGSDVTSLTFNYVAIKYT